MNYTEKIETQEHLKNDVLCYWQMQGYIDNETGITSRHLPKGQNLLIFNYGNEIGYLDEDKIEFSNPEFFIVAAINSSRIINQKGKIDLFGISFIGEGLFKLIQQPAKDFIRDSPNALKEKYRDLYIKMSKENFSGKTEMAERFVAGNLNQKMSSPPFQQAIKIINRAQGNILVHEIANKVYVSERQLQRLFKTRLGISPKEYCKIVRVNNYLEFILKKRNSVDWMELVVKFNYHDQPHLINEVKSISRLSPKKLLSYRDTLYDRYTS